MASFSFTDHFEDEVLPNRPYLTREICIRVVKGAIRIEIQSNGWVRFWAILAELDGRAVRVVTLPDRRTIHTAFIDRGFRP